ncbi:uncharacterized protein LOC141680144 [Apium graveolens]|uniref:uncharacterized protein LOC141680144 n=1 Tax=Apium graveolens TaxID=4045 RepID=UPI003D79E9AB
MNLMLEDVTEPLTLKVGNRDRVSVSQFRLKCQLVIHGHSFSADLIRFELGGFNVILGMDWCSQHEENIDYKKKKIVMFTEDNIRLNYQGQRQEKEFLSILKVKKLYRQGCEAYSARIVDIKKETPNLDEISIAKGFLNVFLDKLPGFPADREIDSSTNLVFGAKPVSKTSYCMV